ncbi:hypothetical protein VJ923_00395 [Adlercreutzia sp. R25]|uniref:DUF2975 domain-containing protein n=1 Tax=Adlercreutzia shanghongiae TaxID=3111773 RepID=A0ABU6IYD4_9ACTN|nr:MULTISPECIES: hypothetical protein [unclassified Adlercreutzia]MEC4271615.1 hypothetical protein [Adlercreutzia sp. R25]MEC4294622.1 hypothetical protein [Adlercreutzia sp. R22]
MGRNREIELLERSFAGIPRLGKLLGIIFTICACLSAIMILFLAASPFFFAVDGVAGFAPAAQIAYDIIGQLAMLAVYVMCALVAWDMSKGETPFAQKQVRRALAAACIVALYTLVCFIWDPLFSAIEVALGPLTSVYDADLKPATFFVNFGTLLASAVLFLLAYILNYGKTLQALSDETG